MPKYQTNRVVNTGPGAATETMEIVRPSVYRKSLCSCGNDELNFRHKLPWSAASQRRWKGREERRIPRTWLVSIVPRAADDHGHIRAMVYALPKFQPTGDPAFPSGHPPRCQQFQQLFLRPLHLRLRPRCSPGSANLVAQYPRVRRSRNQEANLPLMYVLRWVILLRFAGLVGARLCLSHSH